MSATGHWIERLQELAVRYAYLGLGADLAGLSLTELWGAYCLLTRIDGGSL